MLYIYETNMCIYVLHRYALSDPGAMHTPFITKHILYIYIYNMYIYIPRITSWTGVYLHLYLYLFVYLYTHLHLLSYLCLSVGLIPIHIPKPTPTPAHIIPWYFLQSHSIPYCCMASPLFLWGLLGRDVHASWHLDGLPWRPLEGSPCDRGHRPTYVPTHLNVYIYMYVYYIYIHI